MAARSATGLGRAFMFTLYVRIFGNVFIQILCYLHNKVRHGDWFVCQSGDWTEGGAESDAAQIGPRP